MNWAKIREQLGAKPGTKEDVHATYQAYLTSPEWEVCRRFMLAFYDHRCAMCNAHENLEVHHRSYANIYSETHRDLIVLCRRCHGLFHKETGG